MDESPVGLKEHFGDARRPSEISVDLKGWMVVEKVRQSGFLKQGQDVLIGVFRVQQPGEKIDDPGPDPRLP